LHTLSFGWRWRANGSWVNTGVVDDLNLPAQNKGAMKTTLNAVSALSNQAALRSSSLFFMFCQKAHGAFAGAVRIYAGTAAPVIPRAAKSFAGLSQKQTRVGFFNFTGR
jgi:hypothetical protein